MCVYECCMAQLSHPTVLYIIGPTVDPSGCAQQTVDFHYRRTLSLYNCTRSTSVQGDHFHSVYLPRAWLEPPCPGEGYAGVARKGRF